MPNKNAISAFWQAGGNNTSPKASEFWIDKDDFTEPGMRMVSLWQRPSRAGTSSPYLELVSLPIVLKSNAKYYLSVRYQTTTHSEVTAYVIFLDYTANSRFQFTQTVLNRTNGQWKSCCLESIAPADAVPMQIILRMSGVGEVLFREPTLRLIAHASDENPQCNSN